MAGEKKQAAKHIRRIDLRPGPALLSNSIQRFLLKIGSVSGEDKNDPCRIAKEYICDFECTAVVRNKKKPQVGGFQHDASTSWNFQTSKILPM